VPRHGRRSRAERSRPASRYNRITVQPKERLECQWSCRPVTSS
jgi:hypothetical protein